MLLYIQTFEPKKENIIIFNGVQIKSHFTLKWETENFSNMLWKVAHHNTAPPSNNQNRCLIMSVLQDQALGPSGFMIVLLLSVKQTAAGIFICQHRNKVTEHFFRIIV